MVIVGVGAAVYRNSVQKGQIASFSYVPVYPSPGEGQKSLQLQTFKFKQVNNTFECNSGTIKGTSEPNILWAMDPPPGQSVEQGGKIKIWYNDEKPLMLGSGSVSPNTDQHVIDPNVGDESARDANNFPYFPALFLTDITNSPDDTSGDAQNGGTPHKPDEVWGTWKALNDTNSLTPNNLVLPSGADPVPATSNVTFPVNSILHRSRETEHAAEIIWDVSKLGLVSGHAYRAQFIIHDGDSDGDIGEGCTTIKY